MLKAISCILILSSASACLFGGADFKFVHPDKKFSDNPLNLIKGFFVGLQKNPYMPSDCVQKIDEASQLFSQTFKNLGETVTEHELAYALQSVYDFQDFTHKLDAMADSCQLNILALAYEENGLKVRWPILVLRLFEGFEHLYCDLTRLSNPDLGWEDLGEIIGDLVSVFSNYDL